MAENSRQLSDHSGTADFVARQVSLVRCDGCGAEWEDLDAATHQDGYSEKGCPNRCRRLTTPVYWPNQADDGLWAREALNGGGS